MPRGEMWLHVSFIPFHTHTTEGTVLLIRSPVVRSNCVGGGGGEHS